MSAELVIFNNNLFNYILDFNNNKQLLINHKKKNKTINFIKNINRLFIINNKWFNKNKIEEIKELMIINNILKNTKYDLYSLLWQKPNETGLSLLFHLKQI